MNSGEFPPILYHYGYRFASFASAQEKSAILVEVWRYFAAVLSEKYQVQDGEAEQLVKTWHYWTGAAVQGFDVDAYRGFFGLEIEALLYQHHF